MSSRAGRTTQNPDRYGYHEHTERIDALLDEIINMRSKMFETEAERDILKTELDAASRGCTTGAEALIRILALCEDRTYVSVNDIRGAIFGNPLPADGTFPT